MPTLDELPPTWDKSQIRGNYISHATGSPFFIFDPRPEEIFLENIAHSGSNIARWGGHSRVHMPIGHHMVMVSDLAATAALQDGADLETIQLAARVGQLHDAHEALMGFDVPTPIKVKIPALLELEEKIDAVLYPRFGISEADRQRVWKYVAWADRVALATEKRDLVLTLPGLEWDPGVPPLSEVLVPWSHAVTKAEYLARAHTLGLR